MSERRKGRLRGGLRGWLLGVALIAAFTHLAAVHAYPRLLMHGAWEAIARSADDTGLVHAPRPDATSRTVVRPSPDLVYSVCLYDLAAGPWSIRLEVPDSYVSVSLYAMTTDIFFAVNDRQATGGSMELLIVSGPVDEYEPATGGRPLVVRAPGEQEEGKRDGRVEIGMLARKRGLPQRGDHRQQDRQRDRHIHVEPPLTQRGPGVAKERHAGKRDGRQRDGGGYPVKQVAGRGIGPGPDRDRQQHDV